MNCRDFDAVVNELADGRPMEAATREAGMGHAAECLPCAARLMDARGVGAALRVAARAETEEAPARVKGALLAAFAERRQEESAAVFELSTRRAVRRRDAAAFAAAAAFLLILGAAYLVRDSRRVPETPAREMKAALPAPSAPRAIEEDKPADVPAAVAQDRRLKRATAAAHKAPRLSDAGVGRDKAGANSRQVARNERNDYMPLTYLSDQTAMESGTVVRVSLSRSALISLGVPLSVERGDELLKADVVIGDDGVARAVRLVGND